MVSPVLATEKAFIKHSGLNNTTLILVLQVKKIFCGGENGQEESKKIVKASPGPSYLTRKGKL